MNINDSKIFLEKGYIIFKIEEKDNLEIIKNTVRDSINVENLSLAHERIKNNEINPRRIDAFKNLNKINNWENVYYSLSSKYLEDLLGPDIAIQSKLNLSIQMPQDKSSILDLHTDSLSGQSVFEVVSWIPLTDSYDSNSMFIFSPEISKEILNDMPNFHKSGMKELFEKYRKEAEFINVKYGEGLIFSPTLFHGNVLNETNKTRISINCRFKNIFSHEAKLGERRLGSFYRILKISEVTKLGLSYRDDLIDFL